MSSASVATMRLFLLAARLNPDPLSHKPRPDLLEYLSEKLAEINSIAHKLTKVLFGGRRLDADELRKLVLPLRRDVELFHNEARRRLSLTRSVRAIMERYATRCMWHHAERLREIAALAKPEARLTADLASYLHDQGLNPLTEPMMGGLRPDVVLPVQGWTIYVEAKQYKAAAQNYLVKGMLQVWDTLGRLRGTPSEVLEAYYVVYRRGGPRYAFPRVVSSEGVTVYPLLIDIAIPSESGARQRNHPIQIPLSALVPSAQRQSRGRGARAAHRGRRGANKARSA